MQGLLGNHTTNVARKIKLDMILRPNYKALITSKVQTVFKHICNIMIRAQLLINYYVITHTDQTVDKKLLPKASGIV